MKNISHRPHFAAPTFSSATPASSVGPAFAGAPATAAQVTYLKSTNILMDQLHGFVHNNTLSAPFSRVLRENRITAFRPSHKWSSDQLLSLDFDIFITATLHLCIHSLIHFV